jgi:uncharacterized protein (DUF3820 family)
MITDESIMPFGKHKGKKMIDVPDEYLLWLLQEGNTYGEMLEYLQDNEEVFKQTIAYNKKKNNRD